MASPECVSSHLLRTEELISPLFCPAGYWGSVISSSQTCSWLLLQLPRSQLLEKVEVVSQRAGEQRRKKRIYTLVFWKLESREKLKNVTWGQNAWLSSYRAERGRFIPIATLWPMSCRELPASVMCSGFRRTSPSLASSLQRCGRKGITEELAALWETCLRLSGLLWSIMHTTLQDHVPGSYYRDIWRLQFLLSLSSSTVLAHSSRLVALKLLIWSLTTISFIPAAELGGKKKSSILLKTDAASVLSR